MSFSENPNNPNNPNQSNNSNNSNNSKQILSQLEGLIDLLGEINLKDENKNSTLSNQKNHVSPALETLQNWQDKLTQPESDLNNFETEIEAEFETETHANFLDNNPHNDFISKSDLVLNSEKISNSNLDYLANSDENLEGDSTNNSSNNNSSNKFETQPNSLYSPNHSKKTEETNKLDLANIPKIEIKQNDLDSKNIRYTLLKLEKKLREIEEKIEEPSNLINPLLPLITELLSIKANDSKQAILEAVTPVIHELIQRKYQENQGQMSQAFASILPSAISQEIKTSPQAIAKAIAPEIAIAIEEQIRLEKDSIARTLGPEMGRAIKKQIEYEKDAMVDALYPVIGNTISKYMREAIQEINNKVENAVSVAGIKRKIQAKVQGVSEAELILRESIQFEVKGIFLIHKTSGLILKEVQPLKEKRLESELLAGMLTAIRSFAKDCFANTEANSELHEIEFESSKIIIEIGGYCYLAVIVMGEPSKDFINKIRETLGDIIIKYGDYLEEFEGDPDSIPGEIQPILENLIQTKFKEQKLKPPIALIFLLLIIIGSIAIPWSMVKHRNHLAKKIVNKTTIALDANPDLSVYRIIPNLNNGKLILTGRVPDNYFKNKAEAVVMKVAPDLEIDNQIIAVNLPPNPTLTLQEIQRMTLVLNQKEGVNISSDYQNQTVTLKGIILNSNQAEEISQIFQNIPRVNHVISFLETRLPDLRLRIYFESNSTELKSLSKIKAVKQFLEEYPEIDIQIIGYNDGIGNSLTNQKLSRDRALTVENALISMGVNPARLHSTSSLEIPPEVSENQPLWLRRCVIFKTFIRAKN